MGLVGSTVQTVLDLRSVMFTSVVSHALCTVLAGWLWMQNRSHFSGLFHWFAGAAMQTVGLGLLMLRPVVPDWMSMLAGNLLMIGGTATTLSGLARFAGYHAYRRAFSVAVLAMFVAVQSYLIFVRPDLTARSVLIAGILCLFCLQGCGLMVCGVDRSLRPLTRWVGWVYGAYSLLFFHRVVMLALRPFEGQDYFQSGFYESLFYIIAQMFFVLLTYSLCLMVNRRLITAIEAEERKFTRVFHSAPYSMLITRLADGAVLDANACFARIMGYSLDDIIGKKSTRELQLWPHEEDRESLVRELREKGVVHNIETVLKKKNGECITTRFSAEILTLNQETCILSTIEDVTQRKQAAAERERLLVEREKALSDVKVLSGLLPICAGCKKIRDDSGYWNQIETYIKQHSEAEFSHGLCPDCLRGLYPELLRDDAANDKSP